ncbi:MAG: hypothetical protein KAT15_20375 [Bacteroidales bacterium]|nr:hypothetical protein [Bacteroidales bacterium]
MNVKLIISGILLALSTTIHAQSMIGMSKEEVRARVKNEHREFRKDNTVVKQRFNYLKYINGIRTRTWILYFTDDDICKTSKLVCAYSEYDEVIEDLSKAYEKVDESKWEYTQADETYEVTVTKQEWYFTVRETRKE